MNKPRRLPSPAMVVAVAALIAGLTGTAIAGVSKNSVGHHALKPFQVVKRDVPMTLPNHSYNGRVQCPGNSRVFAGGVHVVGLPDAVHAVQRSTRVGQGWGASVRSGIGAQVPATMRIQAICVRR